MRFRFRRQLKKCRTKGTVGPIECQQERAPHGANFGARANRERVASVLAHAGGIGCGPARRDSARGVPIVLLAILVRTLIDLPRAPGIVRKFEEKPANGVGGDGERLFDSFFASAYSRLIDGARHLAGPMSVSR